MLEKPKPHRADCAIVTVRRKVGLQFRAACDGNGKRANQRLEELIAIWNARGRPDLSEHAQGIESDWEDGRSRFRIHCGFAAMGRSWARETRRPYYEVFEGIMLEWLEGYG
jgi:hypothetical protein